VVGSEIVMMLAKNPAGWLEILKVVEDEPLDTPVVLGLNAEIADGRDTSWIWDVEFNALTRRSGTIFATGRRVYDLEVRLRVAQVAVVVEKEQRRALERALAERRRVLYLGNYTAFGEVHELLESHRRRANGAKGRGALHVSR
jgi:UDP-N-acetylmuramyl tripeptide synthase